MDYQRLFVPCILGLKSHIPTDEGKNLLNQSRKEPPLSVEEGHENESITVAPRLSEASGWSPPSPEVHLIYKAWNVNGPEHIQPPQKRNMRANSVSRLTRAGRDFPGSRGVCHPLFFSIATWSTDEL